MSNHRHRLHPRLSPLIIRFAEPERGTGRVVMSFNMEDDEGNVTEYYLHATKGWRKRRMWG